MKLSALFSFCLFLLAVSGVHAQTDAEKANTLMQEAIQLMDYRKYDAAIQKLEKAETLDPDNINILYEIGFAQHLGGDTKKAVKTFKKVVKHPDVYAQCYQMLGNLQDIAGDRTGAIKTYEEGLDKFPNAGRLYFEMGNVQEDLAYSILYYEAGINADPTYPSNYFHAARIFLEYTDEEVWGMIYGEIFMNLERNSERTAQMSELLYKVYTNEITFTSDSSLSVSFSKSANITLEDLSDPKNIKLPYGILVYEPLVSLGIATETKIDIESLTRMRERFVSGYYEQGHQKSYPNVLFDYQKILKEKGYLEAYSHWILMQGDEDAFDVWYAENKETFKAFTTWFTENPIVVTNTNKFLRDNY